MNTTSKSLAAVVLFLVGVAPLTAADLKSDLLAREKVLWQAWGDKNGAPLRTQALDEYVQVVAGVGKSSGREAVAKATESHDCVMKSFRFTDANLRQPTPDVAILTYVATQDTTCGSTTLPPKLFVTSMWVESKGKWMAYNYQETPLD